MFLVIAAIFGFICATIAHIKGRNIIGWFFIGFLIGIFGLIIILVVPNLKEAAEKEEHVEMEQRRLREQLRQERLKTEQLRKYTQVRLDMHDKELNVDTRHVGYLLEHDNLQPMFANKDEVAEQTVPKKPVYPDYESRKKIETQCPHCHVRYKVREEHKEKNAKCPKCGIHFIAAHFAESTDVEECAYCEREIKRDENAFLFNGRIICQECNESQRKGTGDFEAESEGRYYS